MPDENDILYTSYQINWAGIFGRLYEFLTGGDASSAWEGFKHALTVIWNVYTVIAFILSALFFMGFVYARIRFDQLRKIEDRLLDEAEAAWAHAYGGKVSEDNRWHDVELHGASENPNDWRLAIIEADIMLEELLEKAGYVGASIGDRLKTANPVSFRTLQDAWDAHKVRNQIAHAGSDFILTRRVALETLVKYERVFREFSAI